MLEVSCKLRRSTGTILACVPHSSLKASSPPCLCPRRTVQISSQSRQCFMHVSTPSCLIRGPVPHCRTHPQMREPRQEFRLFLATPNESNVRGRPDRGSPWIGVPSRLEASSNMFVKKEHNEPFSVSIMHKDEVRPLAHTNNIQN